MARNIFNRLFTMIYQFQTRKGALKNMPRILIACSFYQVPPLWEMNTTIKMIIKFPCTLNTTLDEP